MRTNRSKLFNDFDILLIEVIIFIGNIYVAVSFKQWIIWRKRYL